MPRLGLLSARPRETREARKHLEQKMEKGFKKGQVG